MKNKSKYFYKNINNINLNEHGMNTLSDSNNILPSSKRSNYTTNIKKGKNSNEIFSSNGLSFLIYSSNNNDTIVIELNKDGILMYPYNNMYQLQGLWMIHH